VNLTYVHGEVEPTQDFIATGIGVGGLGVDVNEA
jgi:hypothetical protein